MNSISKTLQVVVFVLVTALVVTMQLATHHEEEGLQAFQLADRVKRESRLIASSLQVGPDGFEPAQGLFDGWERDPDGSPMWAIFDVDGELLFGELNPDVDLSKPTAIGGISIDAPAIVAHTNRKFMVGSDRVLVKVAVARPTGVVEDYLPYQGWGILGFGVVIATGLGIVVHRSFRPVRKATTELEAGRRISADEMPEELKPFVLRINELLDAQEQALEREREFTGNVAHELRTPMAVLHTGLQVLGRRIDERHADTVGDLRETVDEMSTLVDNLLSLSRSEQAKQTQAVRSADLVASIWSRLENEASAKGLSFESKLTEADVVHVSEDGLRVIVTNLLSNAVAYTEEGGHIVVERPAGGVVAVWDSGPVPETAQLDRMFDRLWRADDARTEATKHAGLGLSIARTLAESMGLTLVAEAPAKGGLRFVVR